jgi:MerR family mercuric resistance operon transcriptional regulator
MDEPAYTIAKAAEAAAVGVETVRYYERRGLIAQPALKLGAYRRYDRNHVARIRFIRRAQELGFSLSEIEGVLALQDGTDRAQVRAIAATRLDEIRLRIQDLRRMERTLAELIEHCRHGSRASCPIIEAIASDGGTSGRASGRSDRSPAKVAGAECSPRPRAQPCKRTGAA